MRNTTLLITILAGAAACGKSTSKEGSAGGELTTYDLSKAGPAWKGFTVKVPRAGADVMQDMSTGARVATNGRKDQFDLTWEPGPFDVTRAHTMAGPPGTAGTTFVTDTADDVTWKQEYSPGKFSYHFIINVKVGADTFHCSTMPMGTHDEAQLAVHKTACATLSKSP